jgi:hypothetical protein
MRILNALSLYAGGARQLDGGAISARAIEVRDRKGSSLAFPLLDQSMARVQAPGRQLSDEELWGSYLKCADMRAAIESIVLKVSTWDWRVVPTVKEDDDRYEELQAVANGVQLKLATPNGDDETWQDWLSKSLRDLLVYDTMSSEIVYTDGRQFEELVALRSCDVWSVRDPRGKLLGYRQQLFGQGAAIVSFAKDEMLNVVLHPNTTAPGGLPLIEACVNEIASLLLGARHVRMAFDADEIPPGILLLAGLDGPAARRVEEKWKSEKGQDHNMRVFHSSNSAADAKWIQLKRSMKDVEMREISHEIKRTIWRVFGVKPISMGDSDATPRATAEVQLSAEDSGLIQPILELLAAKMRKVVEAIVGKEMGQLIQFEFIWNKAETALDYKYRADADVSSVVAGILTVNEARAARGLPPREDDGADKTKDESNAEGGDGAGGKDDEAETDDPSLMSLQPGRFTLSRRGHHRVHGYGCACEPEEGTRSVSIDDMPSDWQPESRFKGRRTLDLPELASEIGAYHRGVTPLWDRARSECVRSVLDAGADGKITADESLRIIEAVGVAIDRLHGQWDVETAPRYRAVAKSARNKAADWSQVPVVDNWRTVANDYHDRAMGYLVAEGGVLSDVRRSIAVGLAEIANTRSKYAGTISARVAGGRSETVSEQVGKAIALVDAVFNANQYRIDNWSGKLVDLANEVIVAGLAEGGSPPPPTPPGEEPTSGTGAGGMRDEWYAQWAAVGDQKMCRTCEREGRAGFRPLASLPTVPGDATECRGRCRCVLVFWTRSEVQNGTAVDLSDLGA